MYNVPLAVSIYGSALAKNLESELGCKIWHLFMAVIWICPLFFSFNIHTPKN
jgi:hypothetical protein